VPTIAVEPTTSRTRELLGADASVTVWWGAIVELAAAIARQERSATFGQDLARDA